MAGPTTSIRFASRKLPPSTCSRGWALGRIGEVTAVSRIRRTQRIQEVTGGHDEDQLRVRKEPRGHQRTREDTTLRRFGTVRPRVQIPGPRPKIVFKSTTSPARSGARGSQGGHRFSWDSVAAAASKWIWNRQVNSLTAIAQPIYQHAHGHRTVRHRGLKIKDAVYAAHKSGP
jgi:hypothetical protein